MKRSLIKIPVYIIMLVSLIVTSCLKGDEMNTPPSASSAFLAMANDPVLLSSGGTALNSGLRYFSSANLSYPPTDLQDTATVAITMQGVSSIGNDVSVTLAADPAALLDNYATDSIAYEALPDSTYSLMSTSGVIMAGSATAIFQVVFYPSKIDPHHSFMLALTVSSSSPAIPLSSNYGHVYFHTIGNPYSGYYTVTGSLVDNVVPTITGYYPMAEQLLPLGPLKNTAVNHDPTGFGPNYHPIKSGASVSVYGNVNMIFTFDKHDNVIRVDNSYDDPLPRGRTLRIDPSGINKYDPATKTIRVKYILAQADVGDRTFFDETWVFQHP